MVTKIAFYLVISEGKEKKRKEVLWKLERTFTKLNINNGKTKYELKISQ